MTQKMTPQKVFKFSEHTNCGTPACCNECETSSLIESNIYRVGSEKYYEFFQEKRDEYQIGVYNPVGFDKELMEGDLGKFDMYQGQHVPLDCPMIEEKDVELNKPKVGILRSIMCMSKTQRQVMSRKLHGVTQLD